MPHRRVRRHCGRQAVPGDHQVVARGGELWDGGGIIRKAFVVRHIGTLPGEGAAFLVGLQQQRLLLVAAGDAHLGCDLKRGERRITSDHCSVLPGLLESSNHSRCVLARQAGEGDKARKLEVALCPLPWLGSSLLAVHRFRARDAAVAEGEDPHAALCQGLVRGVIPLGLCGWCKQALDGFRRALDQGPQLRLAAVARGDLSDCAHTLKGAAEVMALHDLNRQLPGKL
mmetsp:Transcript_35257/g.99797  ORF Transcript_35257/g.99797 Transcript_35257/m.99797 type:complete len:228 (-) Transcript_35257:505-1188(-)